MQNRFPLRALLLASAVSMAALAPAAYAETPADTLVVAAQIDDIIAIMRQAIAEVSAKHGLGVKADA